MDYSSEGPWATCDRCKFRVRHYQCSIEWTGLLVCGDCRDPRPPWLDQPRINPREGAPIPNARLDDAGVDADIDNPTLPEDL